MVSECFQNGHISTDKISIEEFNLFNQIFDDYLIDNRLSPAFVFENFRQIIQENTLRQVKPSMLTNELK